jgi:hypothetical protein
MLFCKIVKPNEVIDTQTYDYFINQLNSEISVGCALPFSIPKKELIRIIDMSAKWFYTHYEYAVEDMYYVIPKQLFQTEKFACDRGIILPKVIESVHGLNSVRSSYLNTSGMPFSFNSFDGTSDQSFDKMMWSQAYSGSGVIGSDFSESLMYYVANSYFMDLMQNLTVAPVSYNFNPNTKRLAINGRTTGFDMVLSTSTQVPLEFLMNDEIFFRYCVCKAKVQLSRILGTFNFNLPGGITINTDLIRSEGQEELIKVEEEIKAQDSADFFFVQNSN